MEEEKHKKEEGRDQYEPQQQHQPPYISQMQPVTHEAYGGGLYGKDDEKEAKNKEKETKNIEKEPQQNRTLASETQSADGPDESKTVRSELKQIPISSDRDVEITGMSYIQ